MKEFDNIWNHHPELPKDNPFEVPEGYFETLEDRIQAKITAETSLPTRKQKVIQLVKPILGLAASFALVFLLVHYPISKFMPWYAAQQGSEQTDEFQMEEEYFTSASFTDGYALLQALNNSENNHEFETTEIITFLSTELNDYEIFAEIIN